MGTGFYYVQHMQGLFSPFRDSDPYPWAFLVNCGFNFIDKSWNTSIYLYIHLAVLLTYNHHCMMYYMRLCNVEYSQGSHSYYLRVYTFLEGTWSHLKSYSYTFWKCRVGLDFKLLKITMQTHPKQIWVTLLFNRIRLKTTSLKMTKLTHWKKIGQGFPYT